MARSSTSEHVNQIALHLNILVFTLTKKKAASKRPFKCLNRSTVAPILQLLLYGALFFCILVHSVRECLLEIWRIQFIHAQNMLNQPV